VNKVGAVADFAEQYQCRAATELVEALRRCQQAPPTETGCLLLVGSGIQNGLRVVHLRPGHDGQLELILEDQSLHSGTNPPLPGAPPALGLAQLLRRLDNEPAVSRLTAVTAAGDCRLIVAAAEYTTNLGAGDGRWQVLITARPVC